MSENIEVHSYVLRNEPDGDLDEYHEIKTEDANAESLEIFAAKYSPDSINDHDFFTRLDSKTETKNVARKKKSKKTENVMDVINTELASLAVPVTNNIVEIIENRTEYCNTYIIQKFSKIRSDLLLRNQYSDSEFGYSRKSRIENICPIFPNLLENVVDHAQEIPVEYVQAAPLYKILEDYANEALNKSTKFLRIEIRNITFKHHHMFSLESLLCLKLLELYNTYIKIQETLKDLIQDIKVSRETKDNLKKDILKASPNKKDSLRFDTTVRKYTSELFELKDKYRDTLTYDREITHKIISVWSDVEMVRAKSKRKDTNYVLVVKTKTLDDDEYESKWREIFEEEYSDMLAKIEFDYTNKCIEYRENKSNRNRNETSQKKLPKPKVYIDEDSMRAEIEEIVDNTIRRDIIELSLQKDTETCDVKMSKNTFHFEIYLDEIFVCESELYFSHDGLLKIIIDECFSVETIPENQILRIVLLENGEKVSHVKVYLSELQKYRNDEYTTVEFIYDIDVEPTLEYVGSGYSIKDVAIANKVRLKSSNNFKGTLITTCEASIRVQFIENDVKNQTEMIKTSLTIGNKLKRLLNGIDKPNVETLVEIIGKIYGKDVSNDETVINTLARLCKMEVQTEQQLFPLDENSPESTRYKLLHLRNCGGFTNIENKMVPIHGSQISTEQLNCLQKTKQKEFDISYLKDKEVDMDPIELQRYIAAKYMQRLNKKMLKNLSEHLMVKTRNDVVSEFKDFSLRNLFSRKTNLNSSTSLSNGAKHQILMESLSKEQEIRITVHRAFNLLDRRADLLGEGDESEETIAEHVSGFKVRPLRPFVRVRYHNAVAQTVTAIGCHPTWNHTLKLTTKLSPLSNIYVDVYDACKVNITPDPEDGSPDTTVRYRYFNKWLGTTQVPIFTVLSLGSFRGTFKISTPPILFGYESDQKKESHSLIPQIKQLMKKDTSHIALHITTGLAHLGGFQEYNQPLPTAVEDDYIIKHLNTFVTGYINDFPNRNITLTFIDSAGRNKCVTQFLQPIPLPDRECFPRNPKSCGSAKSKSSGRKQDEPDLSEDKESVSQEGSRKDSLMTTINACLRYVALIPSYEVSDTHVVTLMGLELLQVLHGSPLDHTLLLSSYFLYLGIKSWVAIGSGLPRGRSSYVLIQYDLTARRFVLTGDELFRSRGFLARNEGYSWHVCDAVSGDKYELRDVACPMKTVDYLFDNENIWVNVQSSQDCEHVTFDLTKSSNWRTVFDKNIFVMKQPIASEVCLYSPPRNVAPLTRALEAKIRGKVQKWRPLAKTIWNRYCSGVLRDTLPHWEYWAFNPTESKPAYSQKLKQLMATYRMFGFPLNIPFVNTKSVIAAVKATCIHVNDDLNVEFALGVEVCAYPNNVLSVWVFLASVTKI